MTTYNERNKPLTTWLTADEVARFQALAKAHGVTAAAYLRAVVVDALGDEKYTLSSYTHPDGRTEYCAHLKVTDTFKSLALSH